jgi:hypothetical protein
MTTGARAIALLVIVALVFAVTVAAAEAAEATGRRPFRCFRPFKSLDGFSPKHMHARENCDFEYLRVEGASATLTCDAAAAAEAAVPATGASDSDLPKGNALGAPSTSCAVKVSFNGRTVEPKDVLHFDGARYTLKLSQGGKSIFYKGFDGNGFSACCALLGGGLCEWADVNGTQKHTIKECLLHTAEARTGVAVPLHGTVSRPLHTFAPGEWNAQLNFYRNGATEDDLVGRLVVPFTVPELAASLEAAAGAGALVAQAAQVEGEL